MLIDKSIPFITGIWSLSLIFKISHSSNTSTSSFLQSSSVLLFAQTPSNPAMSPNQLLSSNFLYLAIFTASFIYSINIHLFLFFYIFKVLIQTLRPSGRDSPKTAFSSS
ncbi:MAG: hypothetical protein L3V56_13750, partial [Candidatus Magnetoovum sp. WYHC-5]|nr:hypothetical protein [Candidatus Magnetoovum sp. WYHC-5]